MRTPPLDFWDPPQRGGIREIEGVPPGGFADLSDRHNRAGFRTDDLDFGLRHGPAEANPLTRGDLPLTEGRFRQTDRNLDIRLGSCEGITDPWPTPSAAVRRSAQG